MQRRKLGAQQMGIQVCSAFLLSVNLHAYNCLAHCLIKQYQAHQASLPAMLAFSGATVLQTDFTAEI